MDARERILVAIDTADTRAVAALVERLAGTVGGIKLGLEFFNATGPEGVRAVIGDKLLFLDLKYHDIPNTVAGAVRSVVRSVVPSLARRAELREEARLAALAVAAEAPPAACSHL